MQERRLHAERLLRGIGRYARDILFISIDVNTIMKYNKNSIVAKGDKR